MDKLTDLVNEQLAALEHAIISLEMLGCSVECLIQLPLGYEPLKVVEDAS